MDDHAREIRRLSAEVVSNMVATQDTLRAAQQRMPPHQLKAWARQEMSMGDRTLQDVLAFDGTMDGMPQRMRVWRMRCAGGGQLA